VGTWRTATGAKTVLAIFSQGVSLFRKVANQNFTAEARMTHTSGVPVAWGSAGGVVPASKVPNNPGQREIYNHLIALDQPLAPERAEAAGEPMRPAILDKRKRAPDPRPSAPALQVELELPLVAPDERETRAPAATPASPQHRGVAVIDFYL
jgi:hypothetical protein